MDALAQKLRGFQESYKKVSENFGRDDFYVILLFRDHATREDRLKQLGFEDNRYLDGIAVIDAAAQALKESKA